MRAFLSYLHVLWDKWRELFMSGSLAALVSVWGLVRGHSVVPVVGAGVVVALFLLASALTWRDQEVIIAGLTSEIASAKSAVTDAIGDYIDELSTGPMSTLNPIAQCDEARLQFMTVVEEAAAGDVRAAGKVNRRAEALLRLSRQCYASSSTYVQDAALVDRSLRRVATSPALR